jgi:hypothetical protein
MFLAALLLPACATTRPIADQPAPLAFIEDDWPRALAEAKANQRPIFVDAWVPW